MKITSKLQELGYLFGIEPKKIKTTRVVNWLKKQNHLDSNISLACYGVSADRLDRIKTIKELPKTAIVHADIFAKPLSILEQIKGLYCHYIFRF